MFALYFHHHQQSGTTDHHRPSGPINYGFSSAWTMARMKTMDGVDIDGDVQTFADKFDGPRWQGEATAEESRLTLELVEKGIEEGSIGIGMNLGYAPESNPEEFVEIARLRAHARQGSLVRAVVAVRIRIQAIGRGVRELVSI